MGYSTEFKGELLFTKELKASELAELNKFFREDCRQHPEWGNTNLSYIALELNKDFNGIQWDGSEKTYDLVDKVNLVIENMKKKFPEFGLTGELLAQGEDVGDVWRLVMYKNVAYEKKIDLSHKKKVTCPHCDEEFFLEEDTESEEDKFEFVFSGFRNKDFEDELFDSGHRISKNITKNTTHLVLKDLSRNTDKKIKAEKYGCEIWSIEQLEKFLYAY